MSLGSVTGVLSLPSVFLLMQFAKVLRKNDVPSEETIALLKTTLTPWKSQLQDIERTISDLNLKLATMHSQHKALQNFISSFDPVFSPARRLPDDILAEIFYHCLPTHRNPMPATSEAPLSLTLVCQQWRSVALSSPGLWNRLHISFQLNATEKQYDPDDLFAGQWQLRLKGIISWVARSCILPLSISMQGAALGVIDAQSYNIERKALQVIVDHASRLQSLELCLPLESLNTLHTMIDVTAPSTLPMLRVLKVREMELPEPTDGSRGWHGPDYNAAPVAPLPLHSWLSLPSLQEMHFRQRDILQKLDQGTNSLPLPSPIQCSLLTRFSLYLPTNRQIIMDVLRNCPLIEECFLSVDTHMSPPTTDFSPIALPRLRCLGIEREDLLQDSIVPLLDTPSLVSLSIFLSFTGEPLVDLIKRCTSLDKLALDTCLMNPHAVLDILQAAPGITQLALDHRLLRGRYEQDCETSFLRRERPSGCLYDNLACLFRQEKPPPYSTHIYTCGGGDEEDSDDDLNDGGDDDGDDSGILTQVKPTWLLPNPLLPNLKSFSAIMMTGVINGNPHSILEFLCNRIHPLPATSSTPQNYPTSSLESITLVLDGHPDLKSPSHPTLPLDLSVEVARHAASVGRTVGTDILLDISYPWKASYEQGAWEKEKAPKVLVSVKEGLDKKTDHLWPFGELGF